MKVHKLNQKGNIGLIIVVIILVAVGGYFFVSMNVQQGDLSATGTPAPTASPSLSITGTNKSPTPNPSEKPTDSAATNTPVPTTNPYQSWNEYSNEDFSLTFYYPDSFTVTSTKDKITIKSSDAYTIYIVKGSERQTALDLEETYTNSSEQYEFQIDGDTYIAQEFVWASGSGFGTSRTTKRHIDLGDFLIQISLVSQSYNNPETGEESSVDPTAVEIENGNMIIESLVFD